LSEFLQRRVCDAVSLKNQGPLMVVHFMHQAAQRSASICDVEGWAAP